MRQVRVCMHGIAAGVLQQLNDNTYRFCYDPNYDGPGISLTMPVQTAPYEFKQFPPFFDGLLPEGITLDALLRQAKLDKYDYLGQLLKVGKDMVGGITIEAIA